MESSLSRGSELWIVPDMKNSEWRWSMEWSTNFQVEKSFNHRSQSLSGGALKVIEENEADDLMEGPPSSTSPWTLISVDGLLPAKWLIYCDQLDPQTLARELDRVWVNLGKPATRLFPSKTWTTSSLKGLKSECVKASTTEVADEP